MRFSTISKIARVVDAQGLCHSWREIVVTNPALMVPIKIASDTTGSYRVPGL
jgi:hypothetical protein